MMRTKLDNCELTIDRGHGVVSVVLEPLQLVGGSYFVEAWFLNDADSMAITVNPGRSEWFSVKGAALSHEDTSGVFEPRTRWDHVRRNGDDLATDFVSHLATVGTKVTA
jgi:hypothetical protein